MSIAYRASTAVQAQNFTLSITVPGTAVANDIGVLHTMATCTSAFTAPTGWTITGSVSVLTVSAGAVFSGLFYKTLVGGDAGTAVTTTLTAATTPKYAASLSVYSGCDPATPIHAASHVQETVTGTVHTAPSVSVSVAGCWAVSGMADRSSPSSTTINAGTATIRASAFGSGGGSSSAAIGDSNGTVASTGSVSGGTYTGTASTANATMFTVLLKPSSVIVATAQALVYGQSTKIMLDAFLALGTPTANLLDDTYSFDRDNHDHFNDVSSHETANGNGYTTGGQSLTGVTTTYDPAGDRVVFTANPIVWTPGGGQTLEASYCAIQIKAGTAATSPLYLLIDFGGPVSSTGPLTVNPDSTDGYSFVRVAAGS